MNKLTTASIPPLIINELTSADHEFASTLDSVTLMHAHPDSLINVYMYVLLLVLNKLTTPELEQTNYF